VAKSLLDALQKIESGRVVDLSHTVIPCKEELPLEITTKFTDEVLEGYPRGKDTWYILQEILMSSHTGTHIEAPFHHKKDGADASRLDVTKLVGECVLIDFHEKKVNEPITVEDLEELGPDITEGDIVFIRTDASKRFRTTKAHQRPYLTTEAVQWLVDREIACLGIDATGMEVKGIPNQPNHQLLFDNGIPLIENLTNLEALSKRRFFVIILPLPIKGADASPLRVVAIE
jgi:arylformamidase